MTIPFRKLTRGFLALCVGVGAHVAFAAEFYVSPTATAGGNGSFSSPWTLQTALNHPAAVDPGDTIWLRGGIYTGAPFTSYLQGTSASPIIVRQYPGERARIDGNYNGNATTLDLRGSYTWYWGFEVFNSDPNRYSADPLDWPPRRGTGVQQGGDGTRMINMIVHDTSQGVITAEAATDGRIYGCLFYYNGYQAPDRGHGHGIYAQNIGSTYKPIYDNILFQQFGWGIHAYAQGGHLDNFDFQGNVSFNNGGLSGSWHANFLLGGTQYPATSPKLISNYTWNTDHTNFNDLGYQAGCTSPTVTNNYFTSGGALMIHNCSSMTISGNTFYGNISGFTQSAFPNNTYYGSTRPTGVKVFVRPNAYEAKRAHIVVYNWDLQSTVAVDVSGVLTAGDGFEVRNAADFFGAPVLTGTYSGGSITLPMNGLSVATPIGVVAPNPTGPEFNVFVLLPASDGGAPTPTATATRTPTFTATWTSTPLPPTATRTPTAVPPTATWTATAVPPTATRTPTAVPPTATWTATAVPPTATHTPTSVPPTATWTPTAVPPTATHTPTSVPPTATWTPTAVPPTATHTPTSVPPTATWTATAVPPTATHTPTSVPPTATWTPTAVPPTATHTPTAVPPTATATRTPSHTTTPVPPTATATPTETPLPPTATRTPTNTTTAVPPTATATRTATSVPPTATRTPSRTATSVPPTATRTPSRTATSVPPTATRTPSRTPTSVPPTATRTPSRTPTSVPPTATRTPSRTPTPVPPNPTPTPVPGTDFMRIEAEAGARTGPMVAVYSGAAFGGKFIHSDTPNTGTAKWNFTIPNAGNYVVWCRVRAVTANNDSFFVRADSGAEDVYDVTETPGPNFQWTLVNGRGGTGVPRTINPRVFTFSAGSHSIRFRGRDPLTRVDRVIITDDFEYVPTEGNTDSFPGDVWPSNPFYDFIETLARNEITSGCSNHFYCPAAPVTRAQMAVMLLKSKYGSDYVPPPATGTVFSDVPRTAFAAAWIEQLAEEGITSGCGGARGPRYCPNEPVTRAQMAVFLLRAEHGSSYVPPAPTGVFDDLDLDDPFAPWIERLFAEGITSGCGEGIYCPNTPNTRAQMAAFLTRTFDLP